MEEKGRICVTGAGGYVGSWVVKLLLSKGYLVHGTVRDPDDVKNAHLMKLEQAQENLRLFKANLLDYDSLLAAISGCTGVFHVAAAIPSGRVANPEIELIEPAVKGTMNVLKACSEAGVKRVIVVSSVAAVAMNPTWPKDKALDEDSWSDIDYCKATQLPNGFSWYCIAKTTAENEAFKYGERNGLDVLTVCPSLIIGPMLQSTVNASTALFIELFKGGGSDSMKNSVRSLVDVRDVAEALLLVYEKPEAFGRYVCAPHSIGIRDLAEKLKSKYPNHDYPKSYIEVDQELTFSSEKLKRLGWKYRTLEETLDDSVVNYREAGLLNKF